ncbi:MAG: amidohydrolase family protein [Deferrisomatales bacterium]|nr:amidohydrolase family protein [Deferrisomatales bacterium]
MPRIYTARTLVRGDAPPVEGGALLDVGGRVRAVGPLGDLKRRNPAAEVVDFGEALMVPLLVNAHTHLELTDYPRWAEAAGKTAEPEDFVAWILRLIEVKRGLDPEQFSHSLSRGIGQSIAAGTGAVGDICSQLGSRTAYRDAALQGVLFLETLGQDPELILNAEKHLTRALNGLWEGPLALGLSPHSPYSISAAYMSRVYGTCRTRGLRCTTHLAESVAEVEFLGGGRGDLVQRFYPAVGWGGFLPRAAHRNPVEYLAERGGLFPENLLVHGVQLTAPEIDLLGRQHMHLALCPRSNDRLKVGTAPVARLLRAGVNLALGTDSRSSCDSLSIWDEMAFAHGWFEGVLDAPTLFRMGTQGGADALGLGHELGCLGVGKQTSFQVLRPERPPTLGELPDYLVAPGRTAEIDGIVVRGLPVG